MRQKKKNFNLGQIILEYIIIAVLMVTALLSVNFLSRMQNDVFGKFFDKAVAKMR